jgi:hypothetical protein
MPSRRDLISGIATAALAPSLSWASVGNPIAVSAAMLLDGSYALVGLSNSGQITFSVPLPARGHAAAAHPHHAEIVAIARRPGTFAKVIDCANGTVRQTLTAPPGRHFFGHGTFSTDGHLLFTTENAFESGAGCIGVWDRSLGYQRVGEFSSGGIGPHEIQKLPNDRLAVANGGIRTHPNSGREKLNLDTMRSNLTILTLEGVILDRAHVPADQHLNSLRHIAVQSGGAIACGFQWQGDPFETPPLLALYHGNSALQECQFTETLLRKLDGYIGSVGTHGQDGFVASSPRGNRVFVVDKQGEVQTAQRAMDVCGVARSTATQSLITDGTGRVYSLGVSGLRTRAHHAIAFDNHLVAIAV